MLGFYQVDGDRQEIRKGGNVDMYFQLGTHIHSFYADSKAAVAYQ